MAKVVNKILGFIGLEPDEEEYENEQEEMVQPDYSYARAAHGGGSQSVTHIDDYSSQSRRVSSRTAQSRDNKVINVYKNNGSNNLIIFRPSSCEDSSHMIDSLKSNRTVIANFENIDHEKAQRILDMMSGAMYAMCGSVHKVSKCIYVFAPESLDVSGEGKDVGKSNNISSLYMDLTK